MKNTKIFKIILSIGLFAFGVIAMIWPPFVYDFISYILGAGIVLNGIVLLVEYFSLPKDTLGREYSLWGGIVFIVAGIALLAIPISVIQIAIGLIVAIGLLLISLVLILRGLMERHRSDGWIVRILIGVITFFGSMIVFSKLADTSDAIVRIIGGVAIYIGINNLLGTVLLKPSSKEDPKKIDIDFTKK